MLPCIQLTKINGQIFNQPIANIRHIQEEASWVEVITIATRESIRVTESFNTIVSKAAFDLVPFTDANANNRNTAVNRAYVHRVLRLADDTAIIVLKTQQSFYPSENHTTLSPLFENFSGGGGGGGTLTALDNVGGGTGVYKGITGTTAELKSILDSATITVEQVGADELRLNTVGLDQSFRSSFIVSGLKVVVEHTGGLIGSPGLESIGDGDWRFTIPTGVRISGNMLIEGNNTNTHSTGGQLTFRINDTDGHLYALGPTIWRRDTNQQSDHLGFGVVPSYSDSGSERTFVFQNANKYGATGFVIVCSVI